eukprot:1825620-Rhodomonas_salina.2
MSVPRIAYGKHLAMNLRLSQISSWYPHTLSQYRTSRSTASVALHSTICCSSAGHRVASPYQQHTTASYAPAVLWESHNESKHAKDTLSMQLVPEMRLFQLISGCPALTTVPCAVAAACGERGLNEFAWSDRTLRQYQTSHLTIRSEASHMTSPTHRIGKRVCKQPHALFLYRASHRSSVG